MNKIGLFIVLAGLSGSLFMPAQAKEVKTTKQAVVAKTTSVKDDVQTVVQGTVPEHMGIGSIKVNSLDMDEAAQTVNIDFSENFSYVPFTATTLNDLKGKIVDVLPKKYNAYTIKMTIDGNPIDDYLPVFTPVFKQKQGRSFITSLDEYDHFSKGLDGNIIAMWQSHGWYFEPKLNRWEWQRARDFQTVEDLYTQSYVMPFLMPMLENAGAYVMSPRERDVNKFEQIIDNDEGLAFNGYEEHKKGEKWKKGKGVGFGYHRTYLRNFENPFKEGTYREIKATKNSKKVSYATYKAEVPADGDYAIYVSYATLPNSVSDVLYEVKSEAGVKKFIINQKMGGGTWIYLGHFPLKKGENEDVVKVSGYSAGSGVITTDAVKIGGGMGNIERRVETADTVKYKSYQASNHPRFTEGARYWLQWAGVPDSVYSESKGLNDYTDDYKCRGMWVNYLAGGSRVLPDREGLNIPVDLSFAFHTDAGTTMNDDIIGTLGIYCTLGFGKYADGTARNLSRDYTNKVMTNIVNDIRKQYEPSWTRRGMWDKKYFEAKVPEVPAMLLELLSHQNFADMKYGLDPNFRFTVSRAIYKGMLQFQAQREGRAYVVQPLPVNSFAIKHIGEKTFMLSWKPTTDTLTAGADATKYYIYERVGDNHAFKRIAVVESAQYTVDINDNLIHSYKVEAANEGGKSFPSEILALGVAENSKGNVMVVNDFTRVSAPDWFDAGKIAGFYDEKDHGVPYIKDISYIGPQFEFRRDLPWRDDDAAGFGASRSSYESEVIAGNTFDYPAVHGKSIMAAGYSFVSSSMEAFQSASIDAVEYPVVDLILGKQKEVKIGRGAVPNRFKIYTPEMREAVTAYTSKGGNIMVTGAFVGTDIWDKENPVAEEKTFAKKVLGFDWRVDQADVRGDVKTVETQFDALSGAASWHFNNELNSDIYIVESPDGIFAADSKTDATVLRYSESNLPAGVASAKSNYKTFVAGFPFETITTQSGRDSMMKMILNFFSEK